MQGIVSGKLTVVKWRRKCYTYAMPIRWKLAALLDRKGLTGYALAEATGISRQTLYKLMRQDEATRIDGATLDTLCRVLKCKPGDLLEYRKT